MSERNDVNDERAPTEQSPLLPRPAHNRNDRTNEPAKAQETPIPWPQFSHVLFLQLAESLTSQVIYPFTPQLIREIGVTDGDETRVGFYVGLMVRRPSSTQKYSSYRVMLAKSLLRHPSPNNLPLGAHIRPRRAQARHPCWTLWADS